MKKSLFASIAVCLMACSGGEKHNLRAVKEISDINNNILYSLLDNAEIIHVQGFLPGMKNVIKPYDHSKDEILLEAKKLHNAITDDIKGILQDNGIKVSELMEEGFEKLEFDETEVGEKNTFHYGKAKYIINEMEKLLNVLVKKLYIHRFSKYGTLKYYNRPEKIEDLNKIDIDFYVWPRSVIPKLMKWLLIPVKNKNGQSSTEAMFEGLSLTATLEQLDLLRQKVLLATDLTLQTMVEMTTASPYNFNKVEPVAYISPIRKDSAKIYVFTMAYDSTEFPTIRYSIDNGPDKETRKPYIVVPNHSREISGLICVRERGVLKWKPWKYVLK